ncbi:MAG: hypothetical protein GY790_13670 [Bacteroidetes bacterium]|nr:hypothetical protein [Bacteroidota bacterium]
MKKNKCRLGIIILALSISTAGQIRGQHYELDFVYGGVSDAEKLLQAYLEPFANILGSDLNAGWYNTARPHQLGGIDVTVTVSWAKAPSSLLTFDAATLGLSGQITPGGSSIAPTVSGSMDERPTMAYSELVEFPNGSTQEIEYARYTLPNGTGVDYFPLPMAQVSVGLPLGTDVSIRFVPMIQLGDYGEIGLWGVGGKHSISQWLPGIKEMDFLDIAVQGGYSKVSSSVNVNMEPLDIEDMVDPNPDFDWNDQFMVQQVSGWTLNLIASQTISVLTIYEGVGYANSLVDMDVQGHYPIHTVIIDEVDESVNPTYEIVKDPFSFRYENLSKLRLNIGARIKLGVLTLHYDFTHTLYATHSAGIGISFR